MSFKNFVPIALAEKINTELEKDLVFAENCNREYEGKAREIGDTVKILNAGKPTITTYKDGKLHALEDPEELQGSSILMPLLHVAQINFGVDDLDKAQAAGNLYSTYMTEAKEGIADEMDAFIASLAADKRAVKETPSAAITKDNILTTLDAQLVRLLENNVKRNQEISVTASPKFCNILRQAYRDLDTNNHELMQNGKVGRYNTMTIKESNNAYKDSTHEYIQIKTNRAIAFVKPYIHLEPYRVEKHFKDAVKGYALYDGTIVRPKEMIVLKVKYS